MEHPGMKEKFLSDIEPHQGIIHKIVSVYASGEEDRKDLFQEILYQLWKSYPKFEEKAAFSTWMYRVALNTALLSRRKMGAVKRNEPVINSQVRPPEENIEKKISLHMAIDQLNPVDRAIALLYLEQQEYREIAGIMGLSKNHIGVRINRIKKQLRKVLEYEKRT